MALLIEGKTNREIAAKLELELGTVKRHLNMIYAKLGVSNRTEAAILGLGMFRQPRVPSSEGPSAARS